MSKVVKFNNATFWTDDSGILYCEFYNNSASNKLESGLVKLYIDSIVTLCDGKAMPFLIDFRGKKGTFSIAAAKLISNYPELTKIRVAESYITNSIGIKLLITTYKRLYDPITPYGIFKNLNEAKAFCENFKNKEMHGSM